MAPKTRYSALLPATVLADDRLVSRMLVRLSTRLPSLLGSGACPENTRLSWVAVAEDPHDPGQPWARGTPLPPWAIGARLIIERSGSPTQERLDLPDD